MEERSQKNERSFMARLAKVADDLTELGHWDLSLALEELLEELGYELDCPNFSLMTEEEAEVFYFEE